MAIFDIHVGPYCVWTDSTVLVNAATDDTIVHLAKLHVGRESDSLCLEFQCRRLLVDGHAFVHAHLRRHDEDVTCMACVAGIVR